jgi:hypothetical protein
MWMAYWNFAFKKKELYQLMFGVSMNCCIGIKPAEAEKPEKLVMAVIEKLMPGDNPSPKEVCRKYYTFWSIIHGLVSINLVNRGQSDEINRLVLKDAIDGIILSISG